jgi:hypothetical protein
MERFLTGLILCLLSGFLSYKFGQRTKRDSKTMDKCAEIETELIKAWEALKEWSICSCGNLYATDNIPFNKDYDENKFRDMFAKYEKEVFYYFTWNDFIKKYFVKKAIRNLRILFNEVITYPNRTKTFPDKFNKRFLRYIHSIGSTW